MQKLFKDIYLKAVVAFILVLVLLNSCTKDNFEFDKLAQTTWNPDFAVPLISSSIGMENLLKSTSDSVLQIDSDKFITLIYQGTFFSRQARNIINLPDQLHAKNISLAPADIISLTNTGNVTVTDSQTIDFNTGGSIDIDTLYYKSGFLNINASSSFQHDVQVKISIPSATKNGVSFVSTFSLIYTGSLPVSSVQSINLTDYKFDMTLGGAGVNKCNVDYEIKITDSGNPVALVDNISFDLSFSNQKFDKIFGKVTAGTLSSGVDTIDVGLFNSVSGTGTFSLVDPRLKVTFYNSYGVPIDVGFTQLEGQRAPSTIYPITGVPSPLPIKTPNLSQVGQMLDSSFTLNSSNSTIVTVVNNTPQNIIYGITSTFNPGAGMNFVVDSSQLKINLELQLPLYGRASGFVLLDTLDFEIPEADQLQSLTIRAYIENGFPIDTRLQIYFADTSAIIIDSLITGSRLVMPGGPVNGAGKVSSPSTAQNDFVINETKLHKIQPSKKIIIRAELATTGNGAQDVKIYSDYRLNVKLGAKAKVLAKF